MLTRWIFQNGGIFNGKTVLELGCGVGLAGIVASHWASKVFLTDYIQDVVDNAAYNVQLNHVAPTDRASDGTDDDVQLSGGTYTWNVADRVVAAMLDWDLVAQTSEPEPALSTSPPPLCTRKVNPSFHVQKWYRCLQCWPDDDSKGCCEPCAVSCHADHKEKLVAMGEEKFKCDPHQCQCASTLNSFSIPRVDVIIGSELTYNLISCETLAAVVDRFLKPDGVFYEVLSDDRDGVGVFIKHIEERGFTTTRHPAKGTLIGNFPTRRWSKQDHETYSLYTWRRSTSSASVSGLPDMITGEM